MKTTRQSELAGFWAEALREADYVRILRDDRRSPQTPNEQYLRIRVAIILGEFEEARVRFAGGKEFADPVREFLEIQFAVYEGRQIETQINRLIALAPNFSSDGYLQAEFQFVLGYAHSLNDEFLQATRHLVVARDLYAKLELPGPGSAALTNLAIAYNHLNERSLFLFTLNDLEILAAKYPYPAIENMRDRLLIFSFMDKEEYEAAIGLGTKFLTRAEALGRKRDGEGLSIVLAYIQMKLGQSIEDLAIYPPLADWSESDAQVFRELLNLNRKGLVSSLEAKPYLAAWKNADIRGVYKLYLLDILCAKVLAGGDYETLALLAKKSSDISLKLQQALSLVDFRYYECIARIRLGQRDLAWPLLISYRKDAERLQATPRLAKAADLESEFSNPPHAQDRDRRTLLEIEPASAQVTIDGKMISLANRPTILRLLEILAASPRPLTFASAFQKIYRTSFHPLRHQRRIHSLVNRCRSVLGHKDVLVCAGEHLSFGPRWRCHVRTANRSHFQIERRRAQLLERLRKSASSLSITDLERGMDCNRRTIQLDLKALTETTLIFKTGMKKGVRYSAVL